MGSRRGGACSQGLVRYHNFELLESRCLLSGSPWAATMHLASFRSQSAGGFDHHLTESGFVASSSADQAGGLTLGFQQASGVVSYGSWQNDFDGWRHDAFNNFNDFKNTLDSWHDDYDSQSNWQSSGGSLSFLSSGHGSLSLQSAGGDEDSYGDQSSSAGGGLTFGQGSSDQSASGTTQSCGSTSDSGSATSPTLSFGQPGSAATSSPTTVSAPPTGSDIGVSYGQGYGGLTLAPPTSSAPNGPTLSIPTGGEGTIVVSAAPPSVGSAAGVGSAIDGAHSQPIGNNEATAVQPPVNFGLAVAVNLAQAPTPSVVNPSTPSVDAISAGNGHASSQFVALQRVSPMVVTTNSTASESVPMIAASGAILPGIADKLAVQGKAAGAAHSIVAAASHLTNGLPLQSALADAVMAGDGFEHSPAIAGMPVSLAGVNLGIDTVMSQIGSLGTGFSRWWDDLHANPTTLALAASAVGAAMTTYIRRRYSRKVEEIEDEASSSWLFARMQTSSAE